jgi:hypothetical protein
MAILQRQAVIVLGMHRSGTSAVAGTAVRLGLAPPRRMLPSSADNPSGFYEAVSLTTFNETVLHTAGCAWHDCLSFDLNRFDDADRAAVADVGLRILQDEFADAPAFLIKDPRLCLTLPVWLPALRVAGAATAVLLVIRHPEEVVRSLSRRDKLPEPAMAALWLHYLLEAERATRSLPRAVVAYDDLMHDWRGCMEHAGWTAGISWPAGVGGDRSDIVAFLDPASRHHAAARGPAAVGPAPIRGLIDLAWSALQELRHNPAASFPLEWLDQVHATFAARRGLIGSR